MITWKEAEQIFYRLIESTFKFHLKKNFHTKLHKIFKQNFEKLEDYDPLENDFEIIEDSEEVAQDQAEEGRR